MVSRDFLCIVGVLTIVGYYQITSYRYSYALASVPGRCKMMTHDTYVAMDTVGDIESWEPVPTTPLAPS